MFPLASVSVLVTWSPEMSVAAAPGSLVCIPHLQGWAGPKCSWTSPSQRVAVSITITCVDTPFWHKFSPEILLVKLSHKKFQVAMVTNLLRLQCRLQTAVEAVTCSFRKTYLKFLLHILALNSDTFL